MFPLLLSTTLTFIGIYSSFIGKQILKWINRPSEKEKDLIKKRSILKLEQDKMNMTESFAKYSKIQRQINAIDEELSKFRNERNNLTLQLGLTHGLRFFMGIVLIFLSFFYRNSPVFKISSIVDLSPFNQIICYPNPDNHISFHFWVLCCSSFARLIKN